MALGSRGLLENLLVEHHRRVEPARWLVSLVRDGTVALAGEPITLDAIYVGAAELPDEDG